MGMELTFKKCTSEDVHTLSQLSRKTFFESYSHMNTPDNMRTYLEKAYNIGQLRGELLDHNSLFYFLYADGELAGYIKINESPAQTDIHDLQSLEIERLYVVKEFQGEGLGSALLNRAIDVANMRGKTYIWLSVWEKNDNAILFYKKNGFSEFGKHFFIMGEEEQTDFFMRKNL